MSRIIEKIILATTVPIIIFSLFGGMVGGYGLLFLGEWRLVIFSFLVTLFFPYTYAIITIPFLPLHALMFHLLEKNKRRTGAVVGFVSNFIMTAINIIWVLAVFIFAVSMSENNKDHPIPYLLYFWQIAIGPFQYMASKEPPDSIGTYIGVYLLQTSYLILVGFYFTRMLFLALPLIILISIIIQVYVVYLAFQLDALEREHKLTY